MSSPDDAKVKQIVLRHMNADHSSDLGLYLRHVNGLSAEQLAAEGAPEMVDMDLASMQIRTSKSGTVHVVPLEPPMASWSESRTRLVALAMEARTAFGVPLPGSHGSAPARPVPFHLPTGFDIVVFGGVVLYLVQAVFVYSGHDEASAANWSRSLASIGIAPPSSASAATAGFLSRTFAGPEGFRRVVRSLLLPVVAIHLTEAWWFARTRLRPHRIPVLSRDGALWLLFCTLEGFRSFGRFDRVAAAAAAKKL